MVHNFQEDATPDTIAGMTQRRALFWMVGCLLLAALLRLPALSQFPPGLHYDEAANAILAGDIGLRGARPLFIPSYTGKEVLFFYLAGGVMRLVGESVFALRLTAACLGLLTVAAAYRVGRELPRDRRTALLGAALLAVSFWHLLFSRLGFRAISQPLLQALTVAALWRGLRLVETKPTDAQTWATFALGGLFLGLTAYTYLAARLFPVLLSIPSVAAAPERDVVGLDPAQRERLWTFILGLVAAGTALAFSTHDIQEAERYAERIVVVAEGEKGDICWRRDTKKKNKKTLQLTTTKAKRREKKYR